MISKGALVQTALIPSTSSSMIGKTGARKRAILKLPQDLVQWRPPYTVRLHIAPARISIIRPLASVLRQYCHEASYTVCPNIEVLAIP
eukprot:1228291-Amphidinium_carterae.1